MQQALLIIVALFFSLYAVLIIYFRQAWIAVPNYKPRPTESSGRAQTRNQKPENRISVIIPARNEEQNINACLNSLASQSYPKDLFEILVVDDFSTDKTAELVSNYAAQNVKLIQLKDFITDVDLNSYKKKAIEIAIGQSTGELIVTTDADCTMSPTWLQTIAAFYEENKPAFIVMPVSYDCNNSFFEKFQTIDFMTLQGITGAAVSKKMLSMCNGANLAYTRKAFNEAGGFKGIDDIASGDDMLLMHKIYKQDPTSVMYLKSKDIIVHTQPMHTLKDFFNQRIRWASKADKYDDKRIFAVLLLVYLFNLGIIILGIVALFNSAMAWWLLAVFAGKTIVELFFLYPVARFFSKRKMLWVFPLMQPFHIVYTIIAGWLGKFGSYKWKDRNVK